MANFPELFNNGGGLLPEWLQQFRSQCSLSGDCGSTGAAPRSKGAFALKRVILVAILVAFGLAGAYLLVRPAPEGGAPAAADVAEGEPIVAVSVPAPLSDKSAIGAKVFEARCASCHGENAAGKQGYGPPLVHVIYEPGHHGDMAFLLAVQNGVRGHHWPFGNMPPVAGLTSGEVDSVVAYVRELQRANGIE